jgi:hypothetical protein
VRSKDSGSAHLRFGPGPVSRGGPCTLRAAPPATPLPAIRRPWSGRPTSGGVGRKVSCAPAGGWSVIGLPSFNFQLSTDQNAVSARTAHLRT